MCVARGGDKSYPCNYSSQSSRARSLTVSCQHYRESADKAEYPRREWGGKPREAGGAQSRSRLLSRTPIWARGGLVASVLCQLHISLCTHSLWCRDSVHSRREKGDVTFYVRADRKCDDTSGTEDNPGLTERRILRAEYKASLDRS